MEAIAERTTEALSESRPAVTLPDWIAAEMDQLRRQCSTAEAADERRTAELRILALCDLAYRYGDSLVDTADHW